MDLSGKKALKGIQNHFLTAIAALFLSSCTLSSATMTPTAFEGIAIGTSVSQINEQAGAPYRIKSKGQFEEYEYIERIQIGPNQHAQNTYILIVKEGKVVDKKCCNEWGSLNLQIQ